MNSVDIALNFANIVNFIGLILLLRAVIGNRNTLLQYGEKSDCPNNLSIVKHNNWTSNSVDAKCNLTISSYYSKCD